MAIYYISPSGTSGGAGTQGDPWDWDTAYAAVSGGSTIMFMDGTYELNSSGENYNITKSGSAGNYITLKSLNKWGAKLDGNATAGASGHYAFNIEEGDGYIKFDGLEIYNLGDTGIHLGGNNEHHIWVTNCKIRNISNYSDPGHFGWGAVWNSPLVTVNNLLFENNWFQDNGDPTGVTGAGWTSHYMYMKGTYITVRNNVFCAINMARGGNFLTLSYVPTGLVVVNNTFYDGLPPADYHTNAAINWENNSGVFPAGAEVSNNIYYGDGTYSVYFINYWNADGTDAGGSHVRNNLTYNLDSFTNGLPPDNITVENNITGNPDFVNPATPDFHLLAESPAVNAAYTAGLPAVDYDGVSRPQSTNGDIGAYEYVNEITRTYSRGSYGSLPADDTDLTTLYSTQDYLDVADDDGTRVGESGNGYILHQFKEVAGAFDTKMDIHCNLQSPLAPSDYPVYLQILDRVTAGGMWVTVVTDNASSANTDFDMDFTLDSGTTPTFANCKDGDGVISSRVYQTNVPLS